MVFLRPSHGSFHGLGDPMSLARLKKINHEVSDIQAWLAGNVAAIGKYECVFRVLLFGSFATGRHHGESDIDLAVIVTDGTSLKNARKDFRTGWHRLGAWPMDLVILTESEFRARRSLGGVCMEIERDGIELFPCWSWEQRGLR